MGDVLVIGLSGQVGQALLPRLLAPGRMLWGLSRLERMAQPGLQWLTGSLETMPGLPPSVDTLVSVGPLDAFAGWFARERPPVRRVVALGSTGRLQKLASADPGERELAERLQQAEAVLFSAATSGAVAATLLRPGLLYGSGRDQTITPLLEFGRRRGFIPLPASATGLRQPVHVDDVADAVLRCLAQPLTAGRAYDIGGAEALPFDAMVRRARDALAPGCRVLTLPTPLFKLANRLAARLGMTPIGDGVLGRLERDQLANSSAAAADFGYAPRPFAP